MSGATRPDYYDRRSGLPMQRGRRLFGLVAGRIPWEEWADNNTRFFDGRRVRRIRHEVNANGQERWFVESYYSDGEFGGWFKDFPPGYWREAMRSPAFDSYEDAVAHIRDTGWVDAGDDLGGKEWHQ